MKFLFAALAALFVSATAKPVEFELNELRADSKLGMRVLSQARRLDNNNYGIDYTWVSGYSIKFQGCHHVSQWNDYANGGGDVRISTKRLVRFRLCPTGSCSTDNAKGCSSDYGDYIIDMNTYLAAYFEAKQTYQAFQCDYLTNNVCGCDNNDNQNYSQDMCLWDCYSAHHMQTVCMQADPYSDDQQQSSFEMDNYMSCSQAQFNNNNNNNGVYYYIGPYCVSQGGAIYLGMFLDDSCTTFADSNGGKTTYNSITGEQLPYSSTNVVDMDCLSCTEPQENNYDGNDADDADDVAQVCENIYSMAGKCEANLPSGTVYSPNNNACNYLEGIKIARKDGTVVTSGKSNKTASVFVGIFVVAFVLLSAYVYYLKTKLDRASINLTD